MDSNHTFKSSLVLYVTFTSCYNNAADQEHLRLLWRPLQIPRLVGQRSLVMFRGSPHRLRLPAENKMPSATVPYLSYHFFFREGGGGGGGGGGEYGYTWARACHIGNLNLTNFRKNNKNVRYIEGWLMNFFFCGVTSRYPAFRDRNDD